MPSVGRPVLYTVYFIVFVDLFQLTFVYPFLPVLVESVGGKETQIALANSFASAGEAIGCPILGSFADRFGRRPVLLLSTLGSAATAVMLGFSTNYYMILGARLLNGLSGGTMGIANAYIADVTTSEERPTYMSNLMAGLGLGISVGPVVGSFLYGIGGIKLACVSAGGVSAINFLCILFFLPESVASRRGGRGSVAAAEALNDGAEAGTAEAAPARPAPPTSSRLPCSIWFMFLAGMLVAPLSVVFDTFGNIFVTGEFFHGDADAGTAFFGRVLAGVGAVVLIVPLFLYKHLLRLLTFRGSVMVGGLVGALGFLGNGLSPKPWLFFTGCIVWAIGLQMLGPAIPTMITRLVQPHQFGKSLGLYQSFSNISRVLGPLALSPIYGLQHNLVFFIPAGSLLLVSMVLLILSTSRSAPRATEEEVEENERIFEGILANEGASYGVRPTMLDRQQSGITPARVRAHEGMPGRLSRAVSWRPPSGAGDCTPTAVMRRSQTMQG